MESEGASEKPWMPKLTLENYLILEHLNVIAPPILQKQIFRMHGLHNNKVPKNDLMDAARSINLMDGQRSTLQSDGISSHVILSLKDVIKNLSVLHWYHVLIGPTLTNSSSIDLHLRP